MKNIFLHVATNAFGNLLLAFSVGLQGYDQVLNLYEFALTHLLKNLRLFNSNLDECVLGRNFTPPSFWFSLNNSEAFY